MKWAVEVRGEVGWGSEGTGGRWGEEGDEVGGKWGEVDGEVGECEVMGEVGSEVGGTYLPMCLNSVIMHVRLIGTVSDNGGCMA